MLTFRKTAVLGFAGVLIFSSAPARCAPAPKDPFKVSPGELCVAVASADEVARLLQKGHMAQAGEAIVKKGDAFEFRGKSSSGFLIAISDTEDGELRAKPVLARVGRKTPFQEKLDFAASLFDSGGVVRLGGCWTDLEFLQAGVAMPVLLAGRPKPVSQAQGKATVFGSAVASQPVFTQQISSETIRAAGQKSLDSELAALKSRIDALRQKPASRPEVNDITLRLAGLATRAGQLGFEDAAARAAALKSGLSAPQPLQAGH